MSTYAALVCLMRAVRKTLDEGGMRIVGIRGDLQALHEKVIFFLGFLESSFTYNRETHDRMSALETMMREAAHKAEDLIGIPMAGIQDPVAGNTFHHFLDSFVVPLVFGAGIHLVLMLGVGIGVAYLAAVTICIICVALLYPALPLGDSQLNAQDLREVLNVFSYIEKQVNLNNEGSPHAALVSLRQILDSALDSARDRAQLESLREKVTSLLDFLGDASIYMTRLETLNRRIIEAAHRARALIESQTPSQSTRDSESVNFCAFMQVSLFARFSCLPAFVVLTTILLFLMDYQLFFASLQKFLVVWFINNALGFGALVFGGGAQAVYLATASTVNSEVQDNHELGRVIYRFNSIVNDAIRIMDAFENPSDLPTSAASSISDWGGTGRKFAVGLKDDIEYIMGLLVQDSPELKVISIVGMRGTGKTTLARLVYDDPCIVERFDIRCWITVSQEYSFRQVLLGLLDSAKMLTKEIKEKDDDGLGTHLYRNLTSRRYLIVMDDVWSTEIWDLLRIYLPETSNRSRVLLTSQLSEVATYPNSCSSLHRMKFLDDDKSWELLCKKVFGEGKCPSELESIGKEIARSCRGLRLAIVVIGGLLYRDNRSETWKDIAKNLKSGTKLKYLEILGLSYNHLPHHLRPCFLYMGVFLGDSEIPVSRLLSLWIAEGFLKPSTCKTLEEVAENNLKELIDRNLIFVSKRSCNGKIRTCSMHGLLRDASQLIAQMENFLHVVDLGRHVTLDRHDETPRRLSIRSDALPVDARHDLISRYHNVRSLLCTGELLESQAVSYLGFVYLRVLDVHVVHFSEFPDPVNRLLLLRYLSFHYDGPLPISMLKLRNLETIVHHHSSLSTYPCLPGVIWSMPNLRHLYVKPGCYLSNLLGFRLPWKSCVLEHLKTLVGIRDFRWSKGIIKRIPNLKKLGISYNVSSSEDLAAYKLESIVGLIQLETLRIIIKYSNVESGISHGPPKLSFPRELKKLSLSLSGCEIPWTAIGALQNLEALKLRCEACCESSWETVDGEFPKLIFLQLEVMCLRRWETQADHFGCLKRVVIKSCGMLEELPWALCEMQTLEVIELVDCHPSAVVSAYEIQKEQQVYGNDVEVRIS